MSLTSRFLVRSVTRAMLILFSMSQATTFSYADKAHRDGSRVPREVRYEMAYGAFRHCLPATGAQVLGGFASPHDWLDPATDEICNR